MTKRISFLLPLCALAALSLPAFAADTPMTDQEYVTKAGQGGNAEVRAGNIAKSNAANDNVKGFGEMMVKDHTKAGKELEDAAKKNGLTFPTDTGKHQAMIDKISAMKGSEFDKAYMTDMVAGHKEMAMLLQSMSMDAKNAALKDWAKKTLPAVQNHLKRAEEILASLK